MKYEKLIIEYMQTTRNCLIVIQNLYVLQNHTSH